MIVMAPLLSSPDSMQMLLQTPVVRLERAGLVASMISMRRSVVQEEIAPDQICLSSFSAQHSVVGHAVGRVQNTFAAMTWTPESGSASLTPRRVSNGVSPSIQS
jgi:hypothetical protein